MCRLGMGSRGKESRKGSKQSYVGIVFTTKDKSFVVVLNLSQTSRTFYRDCTLMIEGR